MPAARSRHQHQAASLREHDEGTGTLLYPRLRQHSKPRPPALESWIANAILPPRCTMDERNPAVGDGKGKITSTRNPLDPEGSRGLRDPPPAPPRPRCHCSQRPHALARNSRHLRPRRSRHARAGEGGGAQKNQAERGERGDRRRGTGRAVVPAVGARRGELHSRTGSSTDRHVPSAVLELGGAPAPPTVVPQSRRREGGTSRPPSSRRRPAAVVKDSQIRRGGCFQPRSLDSASRGRGQLVLRAGEGPRAPSPAPLRSPTVIAIAELAPLQQATRPELEGYPPWCRLRRACSASQMEASAA
jgi:hypothetical protein